MDVLLKDLMIWMEKGMAHNFIKNPLASNMAYHLCIDKVILGNGENESGLWTPEETWHLSDGGMVETAYFFNLYSFLR